MKGARVTVAKQKQKSVQSQAITSHELFPAVVGLWFGALFGLGSLAVRPSLMEDVVLSARIDLILPIAAPPLGITARIVIALIMAALGTMIGVFLARRLTQLQPNRKQRTRTVPGAVDAALPKQSRQRARAAHPDAPSCKPISIHDLDPVETEPGSPPDTPVRTGRRRSLTFNHEQSPFVPANVAPLPGEHEADPDLTEPASAAPRAEPWPLGAAATMTTEVPPAGPAMAPVAAPGERSLFAAEPAAPSAFTRDGAAPFTLGGQVPGMARSDPPSPPRQIFGVAAHSDQPPPDVVRKPLYRIAGLDSELPRPLFDRSAASQPAEAPAPAPASAPARLGPDGPLPGSAPASAPVRSFALPAEPAAPLASPAASVPAPTASAVPEPVAPVSPQITSEPAFEPEPKFESGLEPAPPFTPPSEPQPVAADPQPAPAAVPEPQPGPAAAEMTDLAARLAESMRRRRDARSAAAAAPDEPASAAAPLAPPHQPAPAEQASPAGFAPGPAAQPEAGRPLRLIEPAPADLPATFAAPAPSAAPVPRSLQPLALDAFLDDDPADDTHLPPPRRLVVDAPAADALPGAAAAPPPAMPDVAAPSEAADQPGDDASYASLLDIGVPRTGFVRIEEPEPDPGSPEPVVIFPGQAPLGQTPPVVAPAPGAPLAPSDGLGSFRRFDSPASAEQGQPVDLGTGAASVAPDDAAQALRAALASLQRISGAA